MEEDSFLWGAGDANAQVVSYRRLDEAVFEDRGNRRRVPHQDALEDHPHWRPWGRNVQPLGFPENEQLAHPPGGTEVVVCVRRGQRVRVSVLRGPVLPRGHPVLPEELLPRDPKHCDALDDGDGDRCERVQLRVDCDPAPPGVFVQLVEFRPVWPAMRRAGRLLRAVAPTV